MSLSTRFWFRTLCSSTLSLGLAITLSLAFAACGGREDRRDRVLNGEQTGIVGGQFFNPNESEVGPSSVFIRFADGGGESNCSGSFIGDRVVMTAAHCFGHFRNQRLSADGSGGFRIEVRSDWKVDEKHRLVSETYLADSAAVHSSYRDVSFDSATTVNNDIALIRLKVPRNRDHATKVGLAEFKIPAADPKPGQKVISVSYGFTNSPKGIPREQFYPQGLGLLRGKVFVVKDRIKIANSTRLRAPKDSVVIGNADPRSDASLCMGDSGGPTLMKAGKTWYVIGVTSGGYDCSGESALTSVAYHASWIRAVAKKWGTTLY